MLWRIVLVVGFMAGLAGPAAALDFSFEFSDANGTVTGRILGLEDDTSGQAADSILLDSYPTTYFHAGAGSPPADGLDAVLWTTVYANSFDVSGGEIVDMEFFAKSSNYYELLLIGDDPGGIYDEFAAGYRLRLDVVGDGCLDDCRLVRSATIETSTQPIPEPSAALAFALGIGIVGTAARRRRG